MPYAYHPRISRWLVGVVSSPGYLGGRLAEVESEAMTIMDFGLFTSFRSRKREKEEEMRRFGSFAECHGMLSQQRNKAGDHVNTIILSRSD